MLGFYFIERTHLTSQKAREWKVADIFSFTFFFFFSSLSPGNEIKFLFWAFQLMLISITIHLSNTANYFKHGSIMEEPSFMELLQSHELPPFSSMNKSHTFPWQNDMSDVPDTLRCFMDIQQAIAEESQPPVSKPAVPRSRGRACVLPTFHGLYKTQLSRRKQNWFCIEKKNHDLLQDYLHLV